MNSLRSALFGSDDQSSDATPSIEHRASNQNPHDPAAGASADVQEDDMATAVEPTLPGKSEQTLDGSKGGDSIACPDPSVHEKDAGAARLQDQASKAALYVTHPENATDTGPPNIDALGPDGKLSSAGAATSLKHARASDLPSFPSLGGLDAGHSHSAANLANTNQKPFEHWKPDSSHSAGKAALLAHDSQKPFEHWKPELSSAGSKAAMLAHKGGPKRDWWQPEASKEGNSAAHLAMGKKDMAPNLDYGYTDDGKRRALIAATGALRTSTARKRSDSAPNSRTKTASPARGTTVGSRGSEKVDANKWSSDAMQAARIQHSHASREMYTEHPPVELKKGEAQHQAALKASAVSMAKKMYEMQQSHIDAAAGAQGAAMAHTRSQENSARQEAIKEAAIQHLTLQEAAQRLAEERLSRMKPDDETAFRDYYGYSKSPSKGVRSRLSIRGRRRASSDATSENPTSDRWVDSDDEEQSRRIRKQMNLFKSQVEDVDVKKRQKDRAALIAAAEKKVQAQMHNMDEKVFNDTGKMTPAMVEEWENKARARLQKQREIEAKEREEAGETVAEKGQKVNPNAKVHIGGNKYMTQAEIEEIAKSRIQPTLDEISEQAEKQRAKDEEERLDREEKARQERVEKERGREKKQDEKRIKAEEKAHAREEKHAEKAKHAEEKAHAKEEKQAEKAKQKEERRAAKEEKRRSKNTSAAATADGQPAGEDEADTGDAAVDEERKDDAGPAAVSPATGAEHEDKSEPPTTSLTTADDRDTSKAKSSEESKPKSSNESKPKSSDDSKASATSPPVSPTRGEKGGFRSLLSKLKRKSKANAGEIKSFAGGHRLSRSHKDGEEEEESTGPNESGAAPAEQQTDAPSPSISSLSESNPEDSAPVMDDAPRGRQRLNLKTPDAADEASTGDASPNRKRADTNESEARDQFDETLSPPQPAFASSKSEGSASPHRDSRFVENVD